MSLGDVKENLMREEREGGGGRRGEGDERIINQAGSKTRNKDC